MLFIHRILGTILSILFVVWFLSGLVMIYHTFPRVSQADRLARLDYLKADSLPSWRDLESRIPEGEKVEHVYLDSYLGETVFHIRTDKGNHDIPASLEDSVSTVVSPERINTVVTLWCKAPIQQIDTLYELDQWIPFGALKKEFPIYKFYFADQEKHQLYISSRTTSVLQFTSQKERFWAWLGAIPHWVYFTSLRQDVHVWTDTVIGLSGIGCIVCLSGIYLGIRNFRLARKRKMISPYKHFWYKWHHILGTVFGIFVLTFTFSGMMSLANVQDWGIREKLPFNPMAELRKLSPESLDYPLDYRKVIASNPGRIRQLDWGNFGPVPFYSLQDGDKVVAIDARQSDRVNDLFLTAEEILPILREIYGDTYPMKTEWLQTSDTYYLARKRPVDLPVWKISILDADNSSYYINPYNGQVRYINTPKRWMHWMYPALHSLSIKFLVERPVLWQVVMWALMLGGTWVSVSGLVLAVKYIRRKVLYLLKKLH